MSRRRWIIRVAAIFAAAIVVLCGILVVHSTIYRRRMAVWRVHINCGPISGLIGMYAERHGAPPYAPTGSVREYARRLAAGTGYNPTYVWRDGRSIVYVNLTPAEWEKVVNATSQPEYYRGKPRVLVGWAGPAIKVKGGSYEGDSEWRSRHEIMYWWFLEGDGAAFPEGHAEFLQEVAALDQAIQEALGRRLTDCIIYEEGRFDPSTLELRSDSDENQEKQTPDSDQRPGSEIWGHYAHLGTQTGRSRRLRVVSPE